MTRRIGIYSGTFDPLHAGHIAFARESLRVCDLDEIVLLPEPTPRGKYNVTDASQRTMFIKNAIATIPDITIATLTSRQFTIKDTLPELSALFPQAHFIFLVGSDVVRTFLYQWENLDALLAQSALAIGMRAGDTEEEMTAIIDTLQQTYDLPITYSFVYTPHADVASSQIRHPLPLG
jgi:nicotinate-nucleotide adenylyltransferase